MRKVFAFACVLTVAMPATASTQGLQPVPAPIASSPPVGGSATVTAEKKGKEKLICERVVATGSRLGAKRVCRTESEVAEQRRLDRMALDQQQAARWKSQ